MEAQMSASAGGAGLVSGQNQGSVSLFLPSLPLQHISDVGMALRIAQQAMNLQSVNDVQGAYAKYKEAGDMLSSTLQKSGAQQGSVMHNALSKFITAYLSQASSLQKLVMRKANPVSAALAELGVKEEPMSLQPPIPAGGAAPSIKQGSLPQALWLMRHLRVVLTQGGFLTPVVFVPQGVFEFGASKLSNLQVKVEAFESFRERLTALETVPPERSRDFLSSLDETVTLSSALHAQLYRSCSYLPQPSASDKKKDKGNKIFSRIGHSIFGNNSKVSGDELAKEYVRAAVGIMGVSQFLESRLATFIKDEGAVHKIFRLGHFLQAVIAGVVVRDLQHQLEKWIQKGRKDITRQVPISTSSNSATSMASMPLKSPNETDSSRSSVLGSPDTAGHVRGQQDQQKGPPFAHVDAFVSPPGQLSQPALGAGGGITFLAQGSGALTKKRSPLGLEVPSGQAAAVSDMQSTVVPFISSKPPLPPAGQLPSMTSPGAAMETGSQHSNGMAL